MFFSFGEALFEILFFEKFGFSSAHRLSLMMDIAAWVPLPSCLFISFTCRVSCNLGSSRLPMYAPDIRKLGIIHLLWGGGPILSAKHTEYFRSFLYQARQSFVGQRLHRCFIRECICAISSFVVSGNILSSLLYDFCRIISDWRWWRSSIQKDSN